MKFFPFLRWFPLSKTNLRADLIAGITVAFVLIPQSMAYAQLAGLPAYFGLYAAFLPVIVRALWGSSNQLNTGPVALSSLLTASILAPLAVAGSEKFIELAIGLALLAGILRFMLGMFRIGVIVNFLSHPVILGFTNAAALIIGFSQLHKLLGVQRVRNGHFLTEIYAVFQQIGETHLPSLFMGLFTLGTILLLRKFRPRLPGVLFAVPIAIVISWFTGFGQNKVIPADQLADVEIRQQVNDFLNEKEHIFTQKTEMTQKYSYLNGLDLQSVKEKKLLKAIYERRNMDLEIEKAEKQNQRKRHEILRKKVSLSNANEVGFAHTPFHQTWKIAAIRDDRTVLLSRGGEVVGAIPSGLPKISVPKIDFEDLWQLLPGAFILVLLGFMEAFSVAKIIAAKTRQRFDVNQELIGQGLANIFGSFFSSYPVSGSFARSALNLSMGAVTGMSSVFTGLVVMILLLFFTGFLFYLPQSVLAAVIISAIISLINFRPIIEMRKVRILDAMIALVTFAVTLFSAPRLEVGVYTGAGLALLFYLVRRTKPRAVQLGRHWDGTLRDAKTYHLQTCRHIAIFRFDGSLDYPDVSYFENMVLDIVTSEPKTEFIHVVGDGINFIDASGLEMLRSVYRQLQEMDVQMMFSGLKRQILEVLAVSGFLKEIGRKNIFRTEEEALECSISQIDDPTFDPQRCPLRRKDAGILFEKKQHLAYPHKHEPEIV